MASSFQNFRRPVVYILDQELRKRNLKNQLELSSNDSKEDSTDKQLPQYPLEFVRDPENKRVLKCIHGTGNLKWTEEFIRNPSGKVVQVLNTYPGGKTETIQFIRDPLVHYIDSV